MVVLGIALYASSPFWVFWLVKGYLVQSNVTGHSLIAPTITTPRVARAARPTYQRSGSRHVVARVVVTVLWSTSIGTLYWDYLSLAGRKGEQGGILAVLLFVDQESGIR